MTRFQQYIVAVAVAAAAGILLAVILHGRAQAGLHRAPCPWDSPGEPRQQVVPCLYAPDGQMP